MLFMNKRFLFFIFLIICISTSLFAQSTIKKFQIVSSTYDITGNFMSKTTEKALREVVPVDYNTVFKNQKEFDFYMSELRTNLNNQRVFNEAEIQVKYGVQDKSTGIIPVELHFRTVDSFNVIAIPYPNYNSNNGLWAKVKFRDYNFLGSMKMFDLDFFYNYNNADKTKTKHSIGLNTGFTVPFSIGGYNLYWSNSVGLSKSFYNKVTDKDFKTVFEYNTGMSLHLPIDLKSSIALSVSGGYKHDEYGYHSFNIGGSMSYSRTLNEYLSIGLSAGHRYFHNDKYRDATDSNYINESLGISLPVNLGTIPNWGGITWVPSANFSWNWDVDAVHQSPLQENKTDMIQHSELKGPTITIGHSLGTSKINYIGNFREGFAISFGQYWSYNFHKKEMPMPYFTFNTQLHMPSEYVALNNRNFWYYSMSGSTATFGDKMRGLRDMDMFASDNIIVMNFDVPIKVVTTDWVGWGFPSWMGYADFELHISPFVDIALGRNPWSNTNFLIADGFYTGGLEFIVYPTRMKSIIVRASLGIDAARTILPGRIVNKQNRPQDVSKWEAFIGLGLFY